MFSFYYCFQLRQACTRLGLPAAGLGQEGLVMKHLLLEEVGEGRVVVPSSLFPGDPTRFQWAVQPCGHTDSLVGISENLGRKRW